MLVLSRKLNERIYIGDDITITIARLDGHRVKIGIEAPGDVLVRRAELVDQWRGRGAEVDCETTKLPA